VKTSPCDTFVSISMPYISSTPDRVVDDNIILEVKCPYVSTSAVGSFHTGDGGDGWHTAGCLLEAGGPLMNFYNNISGTFRIMKKT